MQTRSKYIENNAKVLNVEVNYVPPNSSITSYGFLNSVAVSIPLAMSR